MKTVAIHQPNYLPWLGYFDKVAQADTFVIFDDIQLPSGAHHYETRATIKGARAILELNIPIRGRNQDLLIKDAVFADSTWIRKHLRSIEVAYEKTQYFNNYFPQLEEIYLSGCTGLAGFNTMLIKLIASFMGIKTEIVRSSELGIKTQGEQKILDIIKKLGGDRYISGAGAGSKRYIVPEHFKEAGIELVWQDFKHPVYQQTRGEFVPGLSAIDYLMNTGGTKL